MPEEEIIEETPTDEYEAIDSFEKKVKLKDLIKKGDPKGEPSVTHVSLAVYDVNVATMEIGALDCRFKLNSPGNRFNGWIPLKENQKIKDALQAVFQELLAAANTEAEL